MLSNFLEMVGICGLEPQTSSLSVTRSNQLSYIPNFHNYTLISQIKQGKFLIKFVLDG